MAYKLVITEHADKLLDDIRDDVVNVVGIFHQLENYQRKL